MKQFFLPAHIKLVGHPEKNNWAQAFVLDQDLSPEKKLGTLFGTISISSTQDQDATIQGQEILTLLIAKFNEENNKPRLTKLKEIISQVQIEKPTIQIDICLVLIFENALYLVKTVNTQIWLKRDSILKPLLPASSSVTQEIKTASGLIQENDTIILSTEQFFSLIDETKLSETLDHNPLEEISDTLAPQIVGARDSSLTSAIIIRLASKEKDTNNEELSAVNIEELKETAETNPTFPTNKILASEKTSAFDNIYQNIFAKLPKRSSIGLFRRRDLKAKKNLLLIALLLFVFLSATIFISIKNRQFQQSQAEFKKIVSQTENKLNEGKSLSDLNPNKAKISLNEAKKILSDYNSKVKKGTSEDKKIASILEEINKYLEITQKIYKITPSLFYDLTVIKENAMGSAMSQFGKEILLLDTTSNTVYLINPQNKSGEIVAGGPDLKGISLISFYGKNAYCFLPGKGIIRANIDNLTKDKVISYDKSWGEIKNLISFAGNLYLLDSKNKQIWKYLATDTGFSNIKNYLAADTNPDLNLATSLAIDGFVYVLLNNGEILKFAQGQLDNFTISGLESSFSPGSRLFIPDESKFIYVLDPGNKRIVLLNKDGSYESQYEGDKIKEAADFVASETLKKVFLLIGDKIYSFALK